MLAVGLLPFLAFGLLALAPMLESSDSADDDTDGESPWDRDAVEEVEGEDPETEDPDVEDPETDDPDAETPDDADPEAPASTVVTITDAEGNTREVEFTDVDFGDTTPVVEGTEQRDVVDASDTPSVPLQLNTFGGDDTVDFGYSTSVDPGEGTDVLALTITADALANGELEAGVITFDDPLDALAIDINDDATGFVHEVRVQATTTPDDSTTTQTDTLYYVLSASETLTIDQAASEAAGTIVFEDGVEVLTQIELGTVTQVTGVDGDGNPTETETGSINDDPTILVNRDITSEQTIALPAAAPADEG